MIAFGTNRTFVIESQDWNYNANGWEAVFQPLSQCPKASAPGVQWKGKLAGKYLRVSFALRGPWIKCFFI